VQFAAAGAWSYKVESDRGLHEGHSIAVS
jgi:hypothetical protein